MANNKLKRKKKTEAKPKIKTKFYVLKEDFLTSKGLLKAGEKIELGDVGAEFYKNKIII